MRDTSSRAGFARRALLHALCAFALALSACGDSGNPSGASASANVRGKSVVEAVGDVYRFAKISNGAYFFTGNAGEKDIILASYPDFRYEGVGFQRLASGSGGVPVYRFANLGNGGYFYTANAAERDFVQQTRPDMRFEGSTFEVVDANTVGAQPVIRLANLVNGAYLYTTSQAEADAAVASGRWRNEGTAFHAPTRVTLSCPAGASVSGATCVCTAAGFVFQASSNSCVATAPPTAITRTQAARLLGQATFGPTMTEIDRTANLGFAPWVEDQFAKAQTLHVPVVNVRLSELPIGESPKAAWVFETFWEKAATAEDQLRQRMIWALSQIFVISAADGTVNNYPRGMASYMDLLGTHAFGNFRNLLEGVARHPMMGIYLSHMRNQKEDPTVGRLPDENFAREIMQLFTIGLLELNADGTPKQVGGRTVETYTNADIAGLAKVFTGFSWGGSDTSDARFFGYLSAREPNRDTLPMQGYPKWHSTAEKRFLGTVIPAQSTPAPDTSLRLALDTLFAHPNVGPFIGRQLIQRLVASNPSPAYVGRVAAAFANNGQGVRGDMKAVIRAVLLDPEARGDTRLADPKAGRLREPVVRLANWIRAFGAVSASGRYLIGSTENPATQLAQQPWRSPTVFNFYRPGYVPPGTRTAAAGSVAPEFQITTETSVVGYLNFMQSVIASGVGTTPFAGVRDITTEYTAEVAIADNTDALLDRLDLLLTHGQMTATTRQKIRDAVNGVSAGTQTGRSNRVRLAIFLIMASPDYLVLR